MKLFGQESDFNEDYLSCSSDAPGGLRSSKELDTPFFCPQDNNLRQLVISKRGTFGKIIVTSKQNGKEEQHQPLSRQNNQIVSSF